MLVSFSLSILRSVSLLLNSGPYERSNTSDFPLKYAWQCCISWNQLNMLRIRKKMLLTRLRTSNWICNSLFPLDRLCQKNIRQEPSWHFCQYFLKFDFGCFYFLIQSTLAVEQRHNQFDNTRDYKWFLKGLLFTSFKLQDWKPFNGLRRK